MPSFSCLFLRYVMSPRYCGEFGLRFKSCWADDIHDLLRFFILGGSLNVEEPSDIVEALKMRHRRAQRQCQIRVRDQKTRAPYSATVGFDQGYHLHNPRHRDTQSERVC